MATKPICGIPDCGKPHKARGWCNAHYTRWLKYRDPLAGGTPDGAPLAFLELALITNTDACINWPFATNQGRGHLWIDGRLHKAARFVCERVHGPPPTPKHEAAHSCGKGHEGCINPKHLRWATHTENYADQLTHGTQARGERHGIAKLTQADVIDIRRRAAEGEKQSAIAYSYGVSWPTISDIVLRRTWAWLTP